MSAAEKLLGRLQRVRSRGQGKWLASCPTAVHERGDRSPGLAVEETPDGKILLCCHAYRCNVSDIVAAVGLELSDLFPAAEPNHIRHAPLRNSHTLTASDALEITRHDVTLVACIAGQLLEGTATDDDVTKVAEAVVRIYRVLGAVHGR